MNDDKPQELVGSGGITVEASEVLQAMKVVSEADEAVHDN